MFACGAEDQTQGAGHIRQALCLWGTSPHLRNILTAHLDQWIPTEIRLNNNKNQSIDQDYHPATPFWREACQGWRKSLCDFKTSEGRIQSISPHVLSHKNSVRQTGSNQSRRDIETRMRNDQLEVKQLSTEKGIWGDNTQRYPRHTVSTLFHDCNINKPPQLKQVLDALEAKKINLGSRRLSEFS